MMAPMFERLPELVNANAALVRRGRFLTVTFLVQRGDFLRGRNFPRSSEARSRFISAADL